MDIARWVRPRHRRAPQRAYVVGNVKRRDERGKIVEVDLGVDVGQDCEFASEHGRVRTEDKCGLVCQFGVEHDWEYSCGRVEDFPDPDENGGPAGIPAVSISGTPKLTYLDVSLPDRHFSGLKCRQYRRADGWA